MGVVAEMAERMIVMYAGRKIEHGPVDQVLQNPAHPYTAGLIACVPHLQASITDERHTLLEIPGVVPSLNSFGGNQCLFAERCDRHDEQCLSQRPADVEQQGRSIACWHPVTDGGSS